MIAATLQRGKRVALRVVEVVRPGPSANEALGHARRVRTVMSSSWGNVS